MVKGRDAEAGEALATVWRVPDEVWPEVEALIEEHDPPKKTGRRRSDPRKALDGIIHRGRTGCQWNQLPREFGDQKLDGKGEKTHPARRWVVERTFAWLCRWRGILVRYEKKSKNYLAAVQLACALLWYRRLHRLKKT